MEQQNLFVEDIWSAIRIASQAIAAANGSAKAYPKIVGHMLWPQKDPDDAGKYFSNCLDPSRQEKLDPQQLLFIAREARKMGCHILMWFICDDASYQRASPIEPKNEISDLQRAWIESVRRQEEIAKRLEHLMANN